MDDGKTIKGNLFSFNENSFFLEANDSIIKLDKKKIKYAYFDSLFIQLGGNKVSLYIDNPDISEIEPYELLYTDEFDFDTLQMIEIDDSYMKVRIKDSKAGYLPLYVSRNNVFEVLKINDDKSFWEHFFNHKPYTLTNEAEKDSLWRMRFLRKRFTNGWLNQLSCSLTSEPEGKIIKKTFYQGTEFKIIDSVSNKYKVFYMNWDDFFDNCIGWISKENISFHEINKLTKEQVTEKKRLEKRKQYLKKHKVSSKLKDSFLNGRIKEGMNQEMVQLIWGEPDSEKYYGKSYYIPYEWKYQKNGSLYILSFDEDKVLQVITARP